MNIHADKTQVNNSQSAANAHSQKQGDGESTVLLEDNRPEAIAQRKLQEAINNSPRVKQLKPYQEMVNNSHRVKQVRDYQAMAYNFTSQTAQRRVNTNAVAGTGSSQVVQLAGAYEGRMARHETYGDSYTMNGEKKSEFTYHHIIPENKILSVLEKIEKVVDKDDQVKKLKEGIATHAKAQFDEAMVKDTSFYLTNEIKNYKTAPALTVDADEARTIITAKHDNRGSLIGAFQKLISGKLEKLEATSDEAVLTERKDLADKLKEKTFEELIAKYAISGIDDKFAEGAVWMPGNIHRGPKGSYRLDPKSKKQFDEWRDDGGDSFEKAAANLLSVGHFAKLWALNAEMDKMIGMAVPAEDKADEIKAFRDQAVAVLTGMDEVRKLATTKFDESQWESNKVKGGKGIKTDFVRLKEHVPKVGEEKRLEEAKKLR